MTVNYYKGLGDPWVYGQLLNNRCWGSKKAWQRHPYRQLQQKTTKNKQTLKASNSIPMWKQNNVQQMKQNLKRKADEVGMKNVSHDTLLCLVSSNDG